MRAYKGFRALLKSFGVFGFRGLGGQGLRSLGMEGACGSGALGAWGLVFHVVTTPLGESPLAT